MLNKVIEISTVIFEWVLFSRGRKENVYSPWGDTVSYGNFITDENPTSEFSNIEATWTMQESHYGDSRASSLYL